MSPALRHIVLLQDRLKILLLQPASREMLHDTRVVIKKLRALWIIHPIGSTIPFKTSFPALRRLFRRAAQTRDLQVVYACLQTLPDFLKHPQLEKKINKEIKKEKKKFEAKLRNKTFRLKIYEEIRKYKAYFRISSAYILKKNRKHYRETVIKNLAEINPRNAEIMHQLRKVLKNHLYQSEAFHGEPDKAGGLPDVPTIEAIQNQLGKWHDWWNVANWLEIFPDAAEKKELTDLHKQAKTKEGRERRETFREIKLKCTSLYPGNNRAQKARKNNPAKHPPSSA